MPADRALDLDSWLQKLETLHHTEIELGLERVSEVFLKLIKSAVAKKVVTVAGTNGKGSTVKALESLLLSQGLTVATYTSPHFLRYNERVSINGVNCADEAFVESFELIDSIRGDISLTYFEFGTLAALDIIAKAKVDVAILEVGLGGRLDAVNIVDADVAVVTSIGLDHEDWLGSDIAQIGREKAGIFRPGAVAVCGEKLPSSVMDFAEELGTQLYVADKSFGCVEASEGRYLSWHGTTPTGKNVEYSNISSSSLPLNSVSIALQVLHIVLEASENGEGKNPEKSVVESVIASCTMPGRCEILSENPLVVADVAHNPQAAEYLAGFLKRNELPGRRCFRGKVIAIAGMLADKDSASVFTILSDVISDWCLTSLKVARGQSSEDLAKNLNEATNNIICCKDMGEALDEASKLAGQDDCILVFGSFFTVADLYAALDIKDLRGSARG